MVGIYGLEVLECGCKIKHYAGGLTVRSGCKKHQSKVLYVCRSCGKSMMKKELKKHKWTHAY